MNAIISLSNNSNFCAPDVYFYNPELGCFVTYYKFNCVVPGELNFSSYFAEKNKSFFLKLFRNWLQVTENIDEHFLEMIKQYEGRELDFFRDVEYIAIDASLEEIAVMLMSDEALMGKKIIIESDIRADEAYFDKIETLFGKHTDVLRFKLDENYSLITFEQFRATVAAIDVYVRKVKSLRLSPLEVRMYIHDMVRNREYQEVENEEFMSARDLTSVLFGDKIVCSGFARLSVAILKRYGIKSQVYAVHKENEKMGHDRTISFIEDTKYGVVGIYYFDETLECKGTSQGETNSFLSNYANFARTKKYYDERGFIDNTFGDFGLEFVKEFKRSWKKNRLIDYPREKIRHINAVSKFIDGKELFSGNVIDTDKFDYTRAMRRLDAYVSFIDCSIPADVYIRVLMRVRSLQFYECPTDFPFDEDVIYKVFVNSGWEFSRSNFERMLRSFRFKIQREGAEKVTFREFMEFMVQYGYDKRIAEILVTRTLRAVLEMKTIRLDRKDGRDGNFKIFG